MRYALLLVASIAVVLLMAWLLAPTITIEPRTIDPEPTPRTVIDLDRLEQSTRADSAQRKAEAALAAYREVATIG